MTQANSCPICGEVFEKGTIIFTIDYERGVFVVRHVPAQVCNQCGESWIDDETSAYLEDLLQQAQSRQAAVEIINMAA